MKRLFLFLGLFMLLSACGGTQQTAQTAPTPTPKPAAPALEKPTYTVARGLVVDQLQLSGTVAAVQQQALFFTQAGNLKTLYVQNTDVVTKGQLLAEIDLGELPNQLRQAQVTEDQAQQAIDRFNKQQLFAIRRAQLDIADAQSKLANLGTTANAADVAETLAKIQQLQASLEQTRTDASATKTQTEIQLEQTTQALVQAQSDYATAKKNWELVQETGKDPNGSTGSNGRARSVSDTERQQYYDAFVKADAALKQAENAVTAAQVTRDQAQQNEAPAIQQAQAELAQQQAHLGGLNKPPTKQERADAQRAVTRASLALEEAKANSDPDLESDLATAKLSLERIQGQITAGQIYAPFDGKVNAITIAAGDAVAAYKPVLNVVNPAALELLVRFVDEQKASQVGVGMPAAITFTRYSGQTITGTVTLLPSNAGTSNSSVNSDPNYHISYSAPGLALEIGDVSQVIVTLQRKENALWLPPQAVRAFEARRFVVVKDGDRQRRQDVKVGIIGEDRIEILDGLKEGDVVVGQ